VSHDPSEIILIFDAQEIFLIIISVENGYAAKYFCRNHDTIIGVSLMNRNLERTA